MRLGTWRCATKCCWGQSKRNACTSWSRWTILRMMRIWRVWGNQPGSKNSSSAYTRSNTLSAYTLSTCHLIHLWRTLHLVSYRFPAVPPLCLGGGGSRILLFRRRECLCVLRLLRPRVLLCVWFPISFLSCLFRLLFHLVHGEFVYSISPPPFVSASFPVRPCH